MKMGKILKTFILLLVITIAATGQTARVQVIHNSADAAASVVDVYLNDGLLIDDFEFRTASPFIDAPAGVDFDITIQPSNSTDTTNGLWRNTYNLMSGETYVLIADGIVSASGYTPATAFDIYVYPMGREMSSASGNTDVLVFHGATDAPVVDVVEVLAGAGTIVDNLAFGSYAGYLELATADYRLAIKDETGSTTVATYEAPLATLGLQDSSIVVFASGFLTPANNSNGPAFGLWVSLPSGGAAIPLPTTVTSIGDDLTGNVPLEFALESNYPNPFNPTTTIKYSIPQANRVSLRVYDLTGKEVAEIVDNYMEAGLHSVNFNAADLASGIYFYRIDAGNFSAIRKMTLIK